MRCHDVIINQPGLNQRIYGDVSKDQVFHGHTIGHDGEVVTTSNPWVIYETSLGVSTKKNFRCLLKRIWSFHAVQTSPIWKRSPKTPSKTNNWNTPSEASKIAMFILWWFLHSTDLQRFQGEQKSPGAARPVFAKTSSKSHFLPSFVEAKPLPSARKIPIRGGHFCFPNKNPFQRVTKTSCTWHGFRNRNLCFSRDLIFFSSFRSWTSKGCNLKVSGLGQLKTPYHLDDLDFLGLRFLLFLRAKDL